MPNYQDARCERYYQTNDGDHRNCFVRDRDRVMFSYSVQRLSGVAQVASAFEGNIVHNRLTHTLEMAQLGRRFTEKLLEEYNELLQDQNIDLDPNVVETACLGHDIGHPPFGHTGEEALNELLVEYTEGAEGFEGNAQSFRIATKLEPYRPEFLGFNLTRASMLALVKYPRYRERGEQKWGWYKSEKEIIDWIGVGEDWLKNRLEASIMDIADDIAYAAHDLLDFTRAKLIPLYSIYKDHEFRDTLIDNFLNQGSDAINSSEKSTVSKFIEDVLYVDKDFDGSRYSKAYMRSMTSRIIKHFRDALTIAEKDGVLLANVNDTHRLSIKFLKYLTQRYVQKNSQIFTQRIGFKRAIKTIFVELLDNLESGYESGLTNEFRGDSYCKFEGQLEAENYSHARLIADYICSLTDLQAIELYYRITGVNSRTTIYYLE